MTMTQIRAYHRPASVEGAWELLRDGNGGARLLGGGTDLVVNCPPEVREIIDLAEVGLDQVMTDGDGTTRIGATATFTDLLEHAPLASHGGGVMHDMLSHVGSVLHRNSATIGGHLARGRLSDVIPVLLALDATVVTYDGGLREQPLTAYYAGPRHPHIVIEVVLPALSDRSAAACARFSRAAFDHALVSCCCRVDLGAASEDTDPAAVVAARVVVGEPAVRGRRLADAEQALVGASLTSEVIEEAARTAAMSANTAGDWVVSSEYRRHLIQVGVRRCLHRVVDRLEGGSP